MIRRNQHSRSTGMSVGLTRCAGVVWDQRRVPPCESATCTAVRPASPLRVGSGSNIRGAQQSPVTPHGFSPVRYREFHPLVQDPIQPLVATRPQRCSQAFDVPVVSKHSIPESAKLVPYSRGLCPSHLISSSTVEPPRAASAGWNRSQAPVGSHRPKVASARMGAAWSNTFFAHRRGP
jgi:hypothetical protein